MGGFNKSCCGRGGKNGIEGGRAFVKGETRELEICCFISALKRADCVIYLPLLQGSIL